MCRDLSQVDRLKEAIALCRQGGGGGHKRAKTRRSRMLTMARVKPELSPSRMLLTETGGELGVSSWATADPSVSMGTNKSVVVCVSVMACS